MQAKEAEFQWKMAIMQQEQQKKRSYKLKTQVLRSKIRGSEEGYTNQHFGQTKNAANWGRKEEVYRGSAAGVRKCPG